MMVLIELFDRSEPINNVITLSAFRPDVLALIGDGNVGKQRVQKRMDGYIAASGLNCRVEYVPCRGYDLQQVTDCLRGVIEKYGAENCVIDVIGGSEILLLSAGICCGEYDALRIVTQKKRTDEFVWLRGEGASPCQEQLNISLKQIIALAGGELVRNARANRDTFEDTFVALIPKVFAVYMKHRAYWAEFVLYMQRMNQPEYMNGESCTFSAPRVFYVGRRRVDPDEEIFRDLAACGAITVFQADQDMFHARFASETVLKYLCDVGAWLELYAYVLFQRSGLFHEVQMSAVVSWDDDSDKQDVINEIDLIALDGRRQWFISCKTALPDNMVLNEIAALTAHFGSEMAVPVLITASNLEKESPGVYRRAAEMGVYVFDADDLTEERFIEAIGRLRKRRLGQ